MSEISIIFPDQLFKPHPAITKNRPIYLVESERFFTDFVFHKKKLVLHRASMQNYYKNLQKEGYTIEYIPFQAFKSLSNFFSSVLSSIKVSKVHVVEIMDHKIASELSSVVTKKNISVRVYDSPGFLSSREWLNDFFKTKKRYLMSSFYIAQRRRLNLFVKDNKPFFGKWSFDTENREKLPANIEVPVLEMFVENKHIAAAKKYVNENFPDNPGDTTNFFYPINHTEALVWLDDFIKNRLNYFGNYEDAISSQHTFLFHSVLSPVMNIGLITPKVIIDKVLAFEKENPVRFNSLEGFIRQIIGWREFIRAVYLLEGKKQSVSNYFNFQRKLPTSFYDASTGIEPVDTILRRVYQNAYCHHIERLMILGNYLLLTEIDPREVYRWFMEFFIDAYDWVMVPNVFGMSQFADGGLMSTKPYISSSNYLLKMSDFKKGPWCETFDVLYWHFLYKQKEKLAQNPRMSLMLRLLEKKDKKQLATLLKTAENYLETQTTIRKDHTK